MVPNFCETLNGSPVKFHLSPFEMLQRSQFWNKNVAVFLHFEVYLVSNNSLFLFFFKWEILHFIRELFSFFLNFEIYIYIYFLNGLYVRNINNKEL